MNKVELKERDAIHMFLDKMIKNQVQEETKQLNQWLAEHEKEVPFPEGVTEVKNISYLEDGQSCHQMDVYYPKNKKGTLPVIINVHGGGLLMGSKELNRLFCGQMSKMGFLVFCVDYPLVPDVEIYQLFSDISAAIDKIDGLLASYGGSREHVYLVGDSAGAYLITYLTAMQKCPQMAQAAGVTPFQLPVRALGLISGMFYTRKRDKIGLFLTSWIYGKGWKKHPFRPYMNPEHPDIVKNLPPCFLITSKEDNLRAYTLQFYRALKKNNVPCKLADCPKDKKLTHAFCALFPELKMSQKVNRLMADYLRQF